MLDGHLLVDAHVHVPMLGSLRPAWVDWARDFGPDGILDHLWDPDGRPRPTALDELFGEQGVDAVLLFCEYSPKVTGYQRFDDLLPIVEHNPRRFRPVANVNPHLHFPIAEEVRRQLDHGAAALKLHPVHGGFRCDDRLLYPAYQVLTERRVPLVVHCGTSSFPGSMNELADPANLLPVIRDFPELDVVLAHGGRGWWYDAAAFMALANERVWIELSGLPPRRLPDYYHRFDLARLARKWIFATDWPGVPGTAANARAVVGLGLDETLAGLVLGGNAISVYAGLDHLIDDASAAAPADSPPGHQPTQGERPMTTSPTSPTRGYLGRPAGELSDGELEQQGKNAHDTRNWVFLHGTAEQFATHTTRMLELESEYVRRYPKRTWQGSGGAPTGGSEAVAGGDDPTTALLRQVAAQDGGRMNKLEVHQLAREVGLERAALARLYNADPPLLRTDKQDRVITEAGLAAL